MKRKNSTATVEIERLNALVTDYDFKNKSLKKEMKALEEEKASLQKKLV